jgi:predicted ATPase
VSLDPDLLARRRDTRRFGPGPYLLGLERHPRRWGTGFPYDLPVFAGLEALRLDAPVTLVAGDNGTGKSTLVEALAEAIGFAPQGGELERSGEPPARTRPALGGGLLPVLSRTRPRTGYFLRAESFFGVAQQIDGGGIHAPDRSLYGDRPLHEQSHGQAFLALAEHRFHGQGIYLLDEPEAALSVTGALALLAVIARAAAAGAQFVVATHSPVILGCPGARIYELGPRGPLLCDYEDLDAVRLTRGFLEDRARYLRAALGEDER